MSVTHLRTPKQRPDAELVSAIEELLEAVKTGRVRSAGLIVVNPLHEIETIAVGDLTSLGTNMLISGCSRLFHKLVDD